MKKLKQALSLLAAFTCLGAAFTILMDTGLPKPGDNSRGSDANYFAAVGSPAPGFALRNISNDLVPLQPSKAKVTILNFWSTSCAPCQWEMPELQQLQNQHPDLLRIIAINMGDTRDAVTAWRDHFDLSLDLLLDPALEVAKRYRIRGLPTTFMLDDRLIIRAVYFGPITYDQALHDIQRLALKV
ncbi:MAG: TlpA disulfide reductase family protein [Chloroflexi bacterium]|nr:TlpA disulfide reductase family protein [Chloroflexota bacterium]